jgi:hypothetical protein
MATTPLKAEKEIKETFAIPEEVAILRRDFGGDFKTEEKAIPLSGFWANPAIASRNFSEKTDSVETEVIVNQQVETI